jgi:phasin family protein
MNTSPRNDARKTFQAGAEVASQTMETALKASKDTVETIIKEGAHASTRGFEKAMSFGQDQAEIASKRYDEFASLGRASIDASIAASEAFFKGYEAINAHVLELSKTAINQTVSATQAVFAAKNVQEAAQIQTEFLQAGVSKAVEETTKIGELSLQAANQAFAPLNAQISKMVDRFARPFA